MHEINPITLASNIGFHIKLNQFYILCSELSESNCPEMCNEQHKTLRGTFFHFPTYPQGKELVTMDRSYKGSVNSKKFNILNNGVF